MTDRQSTIPTVVRLLDDLDAMTDSIVTRLDYGDLDTAADLLGSRQSLLDELTRTLEGAAVGVDGEPDAPSAEVADRIAERVRGIGSATPVLTGALTRASRRVLDELRGITARRHLVRHQSVFGEVRAGGWCDVRR